MSVRADFKGAKLSELGLFPPVAVQEETPAGEVIRLMQRARVGCVLVCRGERFEGLFSEWDALQKVVGRPEMYERPVGEAMTRIHWVLSPGDSVSTAIAHLTEEGVRHAPVVDSDGNAVGVVTAASLMRFLVEFFPREVLNQPPRSDQAMENREGG